MENPIKMEYLEVSLFLVQHPNGLFPSSYVFGAYVFHDLDPGTPNGGRDSIDGFSGEGFGWRPPNIQISAATTVRIT